MDGSWALIEKPFGPVHVQAISLGWVVTVRLMTSPGHTGLLLETEQTQSLTEMIKVLAVTQPVISVTSTVTVAVVAPPVVLAVNEGIFPWPLVPNPTSVVLVQEMFGKSPIKMPSETTSPIQ